MKVGPLSPTLLLAGLAVGGALLYVKTTGGAQQAGRDLASGLIGGAADMANGVLQGTVETIGEAVGIPRTDPDKCAAAKAAGRTWDASFDCSALDFLSYLWK